MRKDKMLVQEESYDSSDEESDDESSEGSLTGSQKRCRRRTICVATLCGTFVLLAIIFEFVAYKFMALEFVKVHDHWAPYMNTTPVDALLMFTTEHKEDWVCGRDLYTFGDTARNGSKFFQEHGWIDVAFPSRPAPHVPNITVRALYFKGNLPDAPTVIVQHGNNVNNRHHTVITAAYFLSEMGFNVLAPNLRNHGDSGKNLRNRITWASQEVFDVLGSWDYVVADPEGKLGGAKDPSRTALFGISMGGLIARVAFALEPRIPALLTDSAVWNAREVLEYYINALLPGLGGVFIPSAWFWCKWATGEDLDALVPERLLKESGDTRTVTACHATDDDSVPFQQSVEFANFIWRSDYKVPTQWYQKVDNAYGACGSHVTMHLRWPQKYRQFVCEFFTSVFSITTINCGNAYLEQSPHNATKG